MDSPNGHDAKITGISWGICILLSIMAHVFMLMCGSVVPTSWWYRSEGKALNGQKARSSFRLVKLHGSQKPNESESKLKEKPNEKPIIKTSLAQESATRPEVPKFQSDKNTRAEGGRKSPDSQEVEMPAQDGRNSQELVLFDQTEQKGDLAHEKEALSSNANGRIENTSDETLATEAALSTPGNSNEVQEQQIAQESNQTIPNNENRNPKKEMAPMQLPTAVPVPSEENHGETLENPVNTQPLGKKPTLEQLEKLLLQSQPGGTGKKTYYDPIFGESYQPGFKTNERKSRQIGRFSLGRHPSVDVEKTVIGDYQLQVYRAIAKPWYYECERNRSLVEIGSITIRLLINKAGKVVTMSQMARTGASENQKAFTFRAIKNAILPPMPKEVQDSLIGEQMELYFTFNFSFY